MTRPGAGLLTIVHDPADDPDYTYAALAAHDLSLRQITVHPTPGTASAGMLAFDILTALGAHITIETAARQHLGKASRAFAAAAAWLTAYEIDVVIVLRTHLLAPGARYHLARLATDAGVRVVALWHGRQPRDWAAAFDHPPERTREIERIDAVLDGARPRLRARGCPPAEPEAPAESGKLVDAEFPWFRAAARRALNPEAFAALDSHYRRGLCQATEFLRSHLRALDLDPWPDDPRLGTGRHLPRVWGEAAQLQGFLSALTAQSSSRASAVATIRGAQAGMLRSGVLLQVPADLATARGPGLSAVALTDRDAVALAAHLPEPRLAAAAAIAAFTGLGLAGACAHPIEAPPGHCRDLLAVGCGYRFVPGFYTIPAPARELIDAALAYATISGNPRDLLGGIERAEVDHGARQAGLALPEGAVSGVHGPWHARSLAWVVGRPLTHNPRQTTGEQEWAEAAALSRAIHLLYLLPPATAFDASTETDPILQIASIVREHYLTEPGPGRRDTLTAIQRAWQSALRQSGLEGYLPVRGELAGIRGRIPSYPLCLAAPSGAGTGRGPVSEAHGLTPDEAAGLVMIGHRRLLPTRFDEAALGRRRLAALTQRRLLAPVENAAEAGASVRRLHPDVSFALDMDEDR